MVSRQKEVDMSRGILQLEQDILEWNRNNLMQHMGYTNYRDVDTFVKTLISNNHVNVRREGKKEFYRTTGSGEIWLDNKKEGGSNVETAAGDNISILIDRFGCNWGGRLPLEVLQQFIRRRVPWLLSDEFYLCGVNRQGSHKVFPGTTNPLNGLDR